MFVILQYVKSQNFTTAFGPWPKEKIDRALNLFKRHTGDDPDIVLTVVNLRNITCFVIDGVRLEV